METAFRIGNMCEHYMPPYDRTYTRLLGAAGESKHKVKAVYFTLLTTAGLLLYWKKPAYATRNLG